MHNRGKMAKTRIGRSEIQTLEFGTKRPRVRIPPLRHKNPEYPLGCSGFLHVGARRTNQSKRAMRPLQGSSAKIEIVARSGIPQLRLPEALIFLRFRVFCFTGDCGFFPVCNLSGCSGVARHHPAGTKGSLPSISVNFRFFPL